MKRMCVLAFILMFFSDSRVLGQRDTVIHIYFRPGSFVASPAQLDKYAALFCGPIRVIRMEGNTDSVGSAESNVILSQKRTGYMARYLSIHSGVRDDYAKKNNGESRPASREDDALNRRVDIFFRLPAEASGTDTDTIAEKEINSSVPQPESIFDPSRPYIVSENRDTFYVIKRMEFDNIYFIPDRPVIESYSLNDVQNIARILQSFPGKKFQITGHVNVPSWNRRGNMDSGFMEAMQKLSLDRAIEVKAQLAENGIARDRMMCKGMSNRKMLYPDARDETEMRKNMRVEIAVLESIH